ncbi:hypothetical protein [Burkholderia pseudomallei]|uniref:hypothetical protein n=1 Tax=Burkholderia pseudomallei TaxID=28450 RepID=UPI0011CD907B|nr:hypothetical protein [Burkholderia pseudomallei]
MEMKKILSREEVERLWHNSNNDGTLCSQLMSFSAALESALLEKLYGQPVGKAGNMPGIHGFTMAAFYADDVPVGTLLYTRNRSKA